MTWYDDLFLGPECRPRYKTIQYRIDHRMAHPGVYLVTLPTREGEVLEIIPSAQLLQKAYPTEDLFIIGMAFTHDDAVALIERIIAETFDMRGDVDVAAYLCERADKRGAKEGA